MFLFCLDQPVLCDSIEYWTRWEKNEFIDETLEAIKYLTPKFTESPKKRPEGKSYYSIAKHTKVDIDIGGRA